MNNELAKFAANKKTHLNFILKNPWEQFFFTRN
jgi:hypothetical protein